MYLPKAAAESAALTRIGELTVRRHRKLKEITKPRSGPGYDKRKGDRHKTPRKGNRSLSKVDRHKTYFRNGHFVAWDGEGRTLSGEAALSAFKTAGGNPDTLENLSTFTWHEYTSLGCGWFNGLDWCFRTLANPDGSRLTSEQIFAFMLKTAGETGDWSINVGFYLGYDFIHMLYDIDPQEALIATTSGSKFPGWYKGYWLRFQSKRDLRIGKKGLEKSFHLWDCSGFFQSSFTVAVERWLGAAYPDLPLLKEGKAGRGDFVNWSAGSVEAYNQAELKALVLMMDCLRMAVSEAGYVLSRWDGSGALASAAFKVHLPRKKGEPSWFSSARANTPDPVWSASLSAYFGGRIEYIRYGVHQGYLWHGDLTSAYPAQMVNIPDLSSGQWDYDPAPDIDNLEDFALYHVEWYDMIAEIGLFPFRLDNGYVMCPAWGKNWIWGIELKAGYHLTRERAAFFKISEGWVYRPDDPTARPFYWIRDLFDLRQEAVRLARAGEPGARGLEKVIKLMINSFYGKTVQRIGYQRKEMLTVKRQFQNELVEVPIFIEEDSYPPFYHPAIGGYITAGCRAALLDATATNPYGIICFATDGIYSSQPLKVNSPPEKELGTWEVEEMINATMVMVQPGVYYIKKEGIWEETIRGFSSAARVYQPPAEQQTLISARVDQIIKAYRSIRLLNTKAGVELPEVRLKTMQAALASDWLMRGQFITTPRLLAVYAASNKRDTGLSTELAPSKNLVLTRPNAYLRDIKFSWQEDSKPYDGLPPEGAEYELSDDSEMNNLIQHMLDLGEIEL
jgi:hypothetical protein